jgi:transcriptional regulator with XRE-family HTH domain
MDKQLYTRNQLVLQKLLRELRKAAGLRQQQVADLLDEPQSFVSKYETGERRLDVLELREVCRVLGISLEEFARELEDRLSTGA